MWHIHGLLDSSFGIDLYVNNWDYLSWSSFDKIGFNSISKIVNYEATIKYITKYIKKGFEVRNKSEHCYYCSKNLKKPKVISDLVFTSDLQVDFDFENEYCAIKDLDENGLKDFFSNNENRIYADLLHKM